MTGQYDYIFRHYGVRPVVGGRVEHTVTGEFGTILKEADTHKHYVHARFDGCDQPGLCHPLELDFLAPDEIEAGSAPSSKGCAECHGTGEVFGHADDCRDDLCALNGDMHSCSGKVEPCGCTTTEIAGRQATGTGGGE